MTLTAIAVMSRMAKNTDIRFFRFLSGDINTSGWENWHKKRGG
jgi:hypothetical protein